MSIFNRFFKSRDKPQNSLFGSTNSFFFGRTTSGKTVNERSAMQTGAVYACVRILAETIASLPLHTYKHTVNGKEKALDHNLYHILHNEPNPEMTSFVFRETLMTHLLLWGNAYSQIIRDGRGKVLALYPLMPDRMTVDRADNGEIFYSYRKDNGEVILNKEEVLHIPGLGFDGIIGYSPIAMSRDTIGMAIAVNEYGAKFFANGATPSGVLEHPGVLKDPKKIRDSWNNIYQGSGNAHRVAVLEDGLTFKTISIPPEAAQFLETRKFQTEEICRIFRVPPHLIASLDKATFSNIEHQSIDFVVHTIRPWLVRMEQSFNKSLLTSSENKTHFVEHTVEALLRGDFSSRMAGYSIGIQNGIYSVNDCRNLENLNLISEEEGGNFHIINGNMTKLKDAGIFANKNNAGKEETKNEFLEMGKK